MPGAFVVKNYIEPPRHKSTKKFHASVSSVHPRLNGWAGGATYKKIATGTQKARKTIIGLLRAVFNAKKRCSFTCNAFFKKNYLTSTDKL